MANLMQMLKLSNHVTRDGYDLQKRLAFTAKPGEKLPIYSRYIMPGDVFEIDGIWKTRTAYLNSAAFTRFKEYYDWYIVPIDILWNRFNNWFTNNKDQMMSATSINGNLPLSDEHPYFTVHDLAWCTGKLRDIENAADGRNEFGFSRYQLTCKLLSYLGYGDYYCNDSDKISWHLANAKLSPWRLLAYQCIYAHFGRYEQWESIRPETFNIDYLSGTDEDLQVPIRDIFYNNIYANGTGTSMLELRYANWNKDMFMGLLPSAQYGDEATVDLSSLLNPSDVAPISILTELSGSVQTAAVSSDNVYQNAITAGGSYRLGLGQASVERLANGMGLSVQSLSSALTILALRQAEAKQKYLEIKQSNKYDFASQVAAHFGKRPSNAYSRMPIHIGSWDNQIGIADVDNTNITENEDGSINAPRIAGKAFGRGQGKKIKYDGDVPAVLMCIYHVKPLLDYALPRIDPDNLKTKFTDYPLPEFDRTGMQQVPLQWLMNRIPATQGDTELNSNLTNLLGYAPSYLDCKTDIDEVKGGFYNGSIDLKSWVAPITMQYASNWFQYDSPGIVFNGINSNFFRVNPKVLNPIFATEMDDLVASDKFWVDMNFIIHAVRPLDRNGLPY